MADAPGVKWYGKEFYKSLDQEMIKNVTKAGNLVHTEAKQLLSTPGRSITTVVTKTGKTRKKYGKKGEFVSAPGEPPRKQSGKLLRTLKKKLYRKRLKVRIMDKGRVLEFGSEKMEERPHLRTALERMQSAVTAALTERITIDTGK